MLENHDFIITFAITLTKKRYWSKRTVNLLKINNYAQMNINHQKVINKLYCIDLSLSVR